MTDKSSADRDWYFEELEAEDADTVAAQRDRNEVVGVVYAQVDGVTCWGKVFSRGDRVEVTKEMLEATIDRTGYSILEQPPDAQEQRHGRVLWDNVPPPSDQPERAATVDNVKRNPSNVTEALTPIWEHQARTGEVSYQRSQIAESVGSRVRNDSITAEITNPARQDAGLDT